MRVSKYRRRMLCTKVGSKTLIAMIRDNVSNANHGLRSFFIFRIPAQFSILINRYRSRYYKYPPILTLLRSISMSIYTSEKTLSYVYRLDNPTTGEFYIGYRKANNIPSHLDLPNYKTSASKVTNTFEVFEWKILAEFYDGDDAYDHEQLTIYENWDNPLLLNESCWYHNKKRFMPPKNHSTETKNKISNSHKGKTHSTETKNKLSILNIGKKLSTETKRKMSDAKKGINKSEETKKRMSEAQMGNIKPKIKCPHCEVIGGGGAMRQWHFDNCKLKDIEVSITYII